MLSRVSTVSDENGRVYVNPPITGLVFKLLQRAAYAKYRGQFCRGGSQPQEDHPEESSTLVCASLESFWLNLL